MPREITMDVIFTPTFIIVLDELLDRRERRVTTSVDCLTDPYRTEEATSRPQVAPVYVPPPQAFPIPASADTQSMGTIMDLPPHIMIHEEIEELVA